MVYYCFWRNVEIAARIVCDTQVYTKGYYENVNMIPRDTSLNVHDGTITSLKPLGP